MKHSTGKMILAWLRLIRIHNLLMIILIQVLTWYCILGSFFDLYGVSLQLHVWQLSILVAATVMIAAGGYIINDIQDVDIDRINKKNNNVIGDKVNPDTAWAVYIIINVAATTLGFWLSYSIASFQTGFIFPVIIGLLWFYSTRYKKMLFWGNLIIASLSALTILIVWLFEYMAMRNSPATYLIIFKGIGKINIFIWGYSLFAFLTTLLREWIKDNQDIRGDERYGSRSLPVMIGIKKMKPILITSNLMIMALLAYAQVRLSEWGMQYTALYLLIAVQTLLLYSLYLLIKYKKPDEMVLLSNVAKIIMIAGILSMELICIDL